MSSHLSLAPAPAPTCLCLAHHGRSVVQTPIFMPVGTQGTLKGLTTQQLRDLDCHLMLGNTYHLGLRPVCRTWVMMAVCDVCAGA